MDSETKETQELQRTEAAVQESAAQAEALPQDAAPAKKKDGPLSWIVTMAITFAAALLFCTFVAQPRYVMGESMQNTFQNNDFVFVWKLGYQPQRGDVVIANAHGTVLNEDLIKRVIAVGGDHLVVKDGTVTLNGKKLTESYIKEQKWGGNNVDVTIPKGEVFLMGDNRNNSADSRLIGPLSVSDVEGKVAVRIYPFDKFGTSF